MLPVGAPLPPGLAPAQPNLGPATVPQGNQGNVTNALSQVQNAIRMLEKALPMIPMGTPLHTEILNSMKSLSKHLTPSDGGGGSALELQTLLQMAKDSAQQAPLQALSRMFPGGGPNTPPAMPPSMPTA